MLYALASPSPPSKLTDKLFGIGVCGAVFILLPFCSNLYAISLISGNFNYETEFLLLGCCEVCCHYYTKKNILK